VSGAKMVPKNEYRNLDNVKNTHTHMCMSVFQP